MKSRWMAAFSTPLLLACFSATSCAQERIPAPWVQPGANGKLVYRATPWGDRIMDFSHAGYMGGGVALPDVPVKFIVKPTGDQDDSAILQSAIEKVSAMPLDNGFRGAVLLLPGVYPCSTTLTISTSGVVLRGSGDTSTIKLTGKPHLAIAVRSGVGRGRRAATTQDAGLAGTSISDAYVPSGAEAFNVLDPTIFTVGDWISIRRPVTAAWVKFMQMDDLVRNGRPQTWIKPGGVIIAERCIAGISGKTIIVDVPLSDSFDARYLNPPGTMVVRIAPPVEISQAGVENLRIESPPQAINHTQPHFQALRINGQDCWARDLTIDETMNSVAVGGRRITLRQLTVNRKAEHQGASKPAEFSPNGTQVLLDRCNVNADNVWFAATGAGVSGPVVLLNCTFHGASRAESHQRWSTGLLYDNCAASEGGLEMRNRGSMGSGHGWSMGWGVMWNCRAKDFLVQNPPGALNWVIGCVGEMSTAPRPFGAAPQLPGGTIDSSGTPVIPRSLYLAQLAERLGPQALRKIGYRENDAR